ncbi:MAG: hypothetical protein QM611_01895 [Microbacterium sp.]|uniref:hypothetical protein n=1 Tax=Microbacterium sp. TaxID=51671 RepID=UPI0039E33185
MFFVSMILFVVGIFAFGFSFTVPPFQPFVFVGGLLLVSLAMALPIHFGGTAHEYHGSKR